MQLSKGFWQTYKEVPAEAEIISHQLMLRAGLMFKTASGLYSFLPMGLRSIHKMANIIRQEHALVLILVGIQECVVDHQKVLFTVNFEKF